MEAFSDAEMQKKKLEEAKKKLEENASLGKDSIEYQLAEVQYQAAEAQYQVIQKDEQIQQLLRNIPGLEEKDQKGMSLSKKYRFWGPENVQVNFGVLWCAPLENIVLCKKCGWYFHLS